MQLIWIHDDFFWFSYAGEWFTGTIGSPYIRIPDVDSNPKLRVYCNTTVTEPTNYTRLSKKIIHRADDLANLSPYNPVVREITTDFKPTYISAKIVISSAVTITVSVINLNNSYNKTARGGDLAGFTKFRG
jgi:hypothetical protein